MNYILSEEEYRKLVNREKVELAVKDFCKAMNSGLETVTDYNSLPGSGTRVTFEVKFLKSKLAQLSESINQP